MLHEQYVYLAAKAAHGSLFVNFLSDELSSEILPGCMGWGHIDGDEFALNIISASN